MLWANVCVQTLGGCGQPTLQRSLKSLGDGRITAARIDVWYSYPRTPESQADTPPSQFPFHELENVVMSPHRGGAFQLEELERRRMSDLARTLNAIVHGEPIPHRVSIRAEYRDVSALVDGVRENRGAFV